MTIDRVIAMLDTSAFGLSDGEALNRLSTVGKNLLPRPRRPGLRTLFLRHVRSPLSLVLLGSGLLILSLGTVPDATVVLAVVVLNALIGALQEHRAERAIAALGSLLPETSLALRDGHQVLIPAAMLVPGDLVLLAAGDCIPADLRVLSSFRLQANEASLTGESTPSPKRSEPVAANSALADRASMLFSGTMVVAGMGRAVVVSTGVRTELGRISLAVAQARAPETPLTRSLARLSGRLTRVIGVVALLILVVARLRQYPVLDAIRAAVAFTCAAIPEALPAMISIALGVGVRRMAARNAMVRTLPSVEALGSTTVICSDKTGTLTRGEMTARRLWTPGALYELTGIGYIPLGKLQRRGERVRQLPPELIELCLAGLLCNEASLAEHDGSFHGLGDPLEIALVVAAEKLGISTSAARAAWPRLDVMPFDADTRYMATLHHRPGGGQRLFWKGAPEVLLPYCHQAGQQEPFDRTAELEAVDLLAATGLRVIAIAVRDPPLQRTSIESDDFQGATLLGLVGMLDPPRPEAMRAAAVCKRAGIRVKMVTGDHPQTARAVARELGFSERSPVLTAADLSLLSDEELERRVLDVDVYARVRPDQKPRLVRALQALGEVVAMTGDGVNDAAALKQADVGVAMGQCGTAAARQAADIILADDNFASIGAAVEEGRRCYDNLIKALLFLVPTNIGQAVIVLLGVLFFPVIDGRPLLPMLPAQVLWVNLVTSVTLALPLAFEEPEHDLMSRPPRRRDAPLFSGKLILRTFIVGSLIAIGTVGLFFHEYPELAQLPPDLALRRAQTMAATTVVLFQVVYLLQCRSLHSFLAVLPFGNSILGASMITAVALQVAFVHAPVMNALFHSAPLELRDWAISALVAGMVWPVVAIEKILWAPTPLRARSL